MICGGRGPIGSEEGRGCQNTLLSIICTILHPLPSAMCLCSALMRLMMFLV
jgi:hypothetical protein